MRRTVDYDIVLSNMALRHAVLIERHVTIRKRYAPPRNINRRLYIFPFELFPRRIQLTQANIIKPV